MYPIQSLDIPSQYVCCGQLWVWHMVCGQTCDGLYHFAFYLVNFGIPFGSHPIKSALARHTGVQVPVVPVKWVTWSFWTFLILPTGIHGLCFGSYFSGPLPLRSLLHGPLSSVHFGESLVVRLYSEIDHTYLSIEAQCVSHHYPWWTATLCLLWFITFYNKTDSLNGNLLLGLMKIHWVK